AALARRAWNLLLPSASLIRGSPASPTFASVSTSGGTSRTSRRDGRDRRHRNATTKEVLHGNAVSVWPADSRRSHVDGAGGNARGAGRGARGSRRRSRERR